MSELDEFTKAYITAALWSSSSEMGTCGKCKAERVMANSDDRHESCGGLVFGRDLSMQDRGFGVDDIAPETLAKMVAECAKFQTDNAEWIISEYRKVNGAESGVVDNTIDGYAGHDFWLTRNGHGCGFWDGDWVEPAASALDKGAEAFGEVDLYIGDDGRIYQS